VPFAGCAGTTVLTSNPEFHDIDGADNNLLTVLDNNYRLRGNSESIDSGNNTNVPLDAFDVNDDTVLNEKLPWDIEKKKRIFPDPVSGVVDHGAFEFTCWFDCVTSATLQPPPDGQVDGADLAVLLGSWSPGPCAFDCCMDQVTSATVSPPPDGVVDGADLAALLAAWNCVNPFVPNEELTGGGAQESASGVLNAGPFSGTYLGMLIEELIATSDPDLAAMVEALVYESLPEP